MNTNYKELLTKNIEDINLIVLSFNDSRVLHSFNVIAARIEDSFNIKCTGLVLEKNYELNVNAKDFLSKLKDLKLEDWKPYYNVGDDLVVCDGYNFELKFAFKTGEIIEIYGDNAHPDKFSDLIYLLQVKDFDLSELYE